MATTTKKAPAALASKAAVEAEDLPQDDVPVEEMSQEVESDDDEDDKEGDEGADDDVVGVTDEGQKFLPSAVAKQRRSEQDKVKVKQLLNEKPPKIRQPIEERDAKVTMGGEDVTIKREMFPKLYLGCLECGYGFHSARDNCPLCGTKNHSKGEGQSSRTRAKAAPVDMAALRAEMLTKLGTTSAFLARYKDVESAKRNINSVLTFIKEYNSKDEAFEYLDSVAGLRKEPTDTE